ncbi:MAG TPA: shikimate dehydrogenase [Casimicrobiaceae bacterium]|nr:shikimate dehydrogenase [Casimicrobiaceae bacterium]HET9751117.1 shikimate dehydrogenase [Casimicrobiaceae bacterium]HWD16847.1 shikimate dehydrogenase [Casimicrobiaceae bacterium]
MITGKTELVAHIGYPTDAFKAPLIYNPWFESRGIDAIVVPMGCQPGDYPAFLRALFRLTNIRGALVTMPHKVNTVALLDVRNEAVDVAGSCNAVRRDPDGRLRGDMFDGAGFTRGVLRKGVALRGASCLVVGAGGVGSAIAASLGAEVVASIAVCDVDRDAAHRLVERLRRVYPKVRAEVRDNDPAGYDIVVNATPLGMRDDDPLPFDVERLSARTFVGEVVMKEAMTPLLRAAAARGCRYQVGTDMLFEMIPAYLEFFGFGTATADELRAVARLV